MKKEEKKKIVKEKVKDFEKGNVSLDDLMGTIKIVSIVGTVFNAVIMFVITFYCILCVVTAQTVTREKLVENESFVNYVEKINNYYHSEAEVEILAYKDTALMVTYEVIVPTICVFIGLIGLIILCKYLYDLTKNVKTTKNLFTREKLNLIKQIRNIGFVATILIWLPLGEVYMLTWALFIIIMEIIIFLFTYCVELNKE